MISLMVLFGILGVLFAMAYFTGRRFGLLGLALAAGALLSAHWTGTVTPLIQQQGVVLVTPPLEIVVQILLILLPPLLLLFTGPRYHGQWPRIAGALLFALFGLTLLITPLGLVLQLDGFGLEFFTFMAVHQKIFIALGVVGAVTDVLLTGRTKGKKREH